MKKLFVLLLTCLAFTALACKKENQPEAKVQESAGPMHPAAAKAAAGAPEGTLLVILNAPDAATVESIPHKTVGDIQSPEDYMLLVPAKANVVVKIESVAFDGASGFTPEATIYEGKECVYFRTIRPEGIPSFRIIASDGAARAEYLVDYDGLNGTPPVEYVK